MVVDAGTPRAGSRRRPPELRTTAASAAPTAAATPAPASEEVAMTLQGAGRDEEGDRKDSLAKL